MIEFIIKFIIKNYLLLKKPNLSVIICALSIFLLALILAHYALNLFLQESFAYQFNYAARNTDDFQKNLVNLRSRVSMQMKVKMLLSYPAANITTDEATG